MKHFKFLMPIFILIIGCTKTEHQAVNPPVVIPTEEIFIQYNIATGEHYCDKTSVSPIAVSEMLFKVKFDSSAVYTTTDPQNQYDINKLYGFTEGQDPHMNSARIGWSYNEGQLKLYAYAYNNGQRLSQEICPVNLDEPINCAIKTSNNQYLFIVNGKQVQLSRASSEPVIPGYQLYPYFGGDETAPHPVRIWIRNM